jgi:hypothetical protein
VQHPYPTPGTKKLGMIQYRRLSLMERKESSRMLAKNTYLNPCNCDRTPLLWGVGRHLEGVDMLNAYHYYEKPTLVFNLILTMLVLFHLPSSSILAVFLLADIRSGSERFANVIHF